MLRRQKLFLRERVCPLYQSVALLLTLGLKMAKLGVIEYSRRTWVRVCNLKSTFLRKIINHSYHSVHVDTEQPWTHPMILPQAIFIPTRYFSCLKFVQSFLYLISCDNLILLFHLPLLPFLIWI